MAFSFPGVYRQHLHLFRDQCISLQYIFCVTWSDFGVQSFLKQNFIYLLASLCISARCSLSNPVVNTKSLLPLVPIYSQNISIYVGNTIFLVFIIITTCNTKSLLPLEPIYSQDISIYVGNIIFLVFIILSSCKH